MQHLPAILTFLQEIGIETDFHSLERETTFLPGLQIRRGTLVIDVDRLEQEGDVLHEAGHLAVVPSELRSQLHHDITTHDTQADGHELAAILWSYAALKHLHLAPQVVFHAAGYKGESEWLIQAFEVDQNYIGLPLLEWKGLTYGTEKAAQSTVAPFPNMLKWVMS